MIIYHKVNICVLHTFIMNKYIIRIDSIGSFYLNMIRVDPIFNGRGIYECYNYNDIIEGIIYYYYIINEDIKLKKSSKNVIENSLNENMQETIIDEKQEDYDLKDVQEFKNFLKQDKEYFNMFTGEEEKVLSIYPSPETEKILNYIKELKGWNEYNNNKVFKHIFNSFMKNEVLREDFRDIIFFGSVYGLQPQESVKLFLKDFPLSEKTTSILKYMKYDLPNWENIIKIYRKQPIRDFLYKNPKIPSYTMNFYLEDFIIGFYLIKYSELTFRRYSHFSLISVLRNFLNFEIDNKKMKSFLLFIEKSFIMDLDTLIVTLIYTRKLKD